MHSRGALKLTTYPDQWKHQLYDKTLVQYQHHLCYLRNDKTSSIHLDLLPAHCPWICEKKKNCSSVLWKRDKKL